MLVIVSRSCPGHQQLTFSRSFSSHQTATLSDQTVTYILVNPRLRFGMAVRLLNVVLRGEALPQSCFWRRLPLTAASC
jgi:hypothetical protein